MHFYHMNTLFNIAGFLFVFTTINVTITGRNLKKLPPSIMFKTTEEIQDNFSHRELTFDAITGAAFRATVVIDLLSGSSGLR